MSKRRTTSIAAVLLSGAVVASTFTAAQADTVEITPIEQVQGTGDTSPLVGQKTTVRGVVTAAYAEGGIRGFYLQSAGSGAQIPTEGSSAVFIYAPDDVASVEVGDHLQVSGTVSEYYGLTQIKAQSVKSLSEPAESIKPLAITLPSDEAGREQIESMLIEPQGEFTVSDNYSLNQYGELTLAMGTSSILPGEKLLRQPTDVFAPGSAQVAELGKENEQRSIVVDDGATLNFSTAKNTTVALPYIDSAQRVSVGAEATFTGPMILDYRYDLWRLQPQGQVIGSDDADIALHFEQIDNSAPQDVGGNVSVGSFNVLNYFTTTGDELSGCSYYSDREGNPVTVRQGCDARGAANQASFERQQSKIVAALSKFTADVVVLEEIENSARFGQDRDAALAHLVDQLNSAAGSKIWKFVPSPDATPADEDVIRTAIIYRNKAVKPIGESVILEDEAFDNAREPLGQAFQKVLLAGDFNSYAAEDPIRVLAEAGYVDLGAKADSQSYVYGGLSGSLDHILASPELASKVTGQDIWNINAIESVGYEYSRYNYNITNLFSSNQYRSSDHDPVLVGLQLNKKG